MRNKDGTRLLGCGENRYPAHQLAGGIPAGKSEWDFRDKNLKDKRLEICMRMEPHMNLFVIIWVLILRIMKSKEKTI